MRARETVRAERRAQILEVALELFARKGFHQTTMDDIVRASGLSKGGLYWHFKSKDDIIAALLEAFFKQEMAGLDTLQSANGPVAERLIQLAGVVADDITQMAAVQAIALEFYAVAARQESVRQFLQDYFRRYRSSLAGLIQQGIDNGEFDGTAAAADEIAVSLVAQFEGLALLWAVDPRSFELRRQSESFMRLMLSGLRLDGSSVP